MIIECINCNKKFNVNSKLIPDNGRQIKCSACNHSWYFKLKKSEETYIDNDNPNQKIQLEKNNTKSSENIFEESNQKIIENADIKKKDKTKKKLDFELKNRDIKSYNFFSYLLVSIISFVALIIVLDTFQIPLINIFPSIEIIIFNLFETLKDIKFFIIDLY